ncbi:hypothetical protein [uncultured Gordonia sp.]|uniref:hypothetical protein n=1 Tax=uncultured Gordonia sp. TaxID=198437 RepID=UPI002595B15E|nr:hypothetical protein [uncultured Gordonia sp.]
MTASTTDMITPTDTPSGGKRLGLTVTAVAVGAFSVFVFIASAAKDSPVAVGGVAAVAAVAVYLWHSREPHIAAEREELMATWRERRDQERGERIVLIDPAHRGAAITTYARVYRLSSVLVWIPLTLALVPVLAVIAILGWLVITGTELPVAPQREGLRPPSTAVYMMVLAVMALAIAFVSRAAYLPLRRRHVTATALTEAELASLPPAAAEAVTAKIDQMRTTPTSGGWPARKAPYNDHWWVWVAARPELAQVHRQCWDLVLAARAEDETSRAHQSAGATQQ